jgi:hypothetical protein
MAAGADVDSEMLVVDDVEVILGVVVLVGVEETVTEKGAVAVVAGWMKDEVAAPDEAVENTKGTNVDVFAGVVVVEVVELAAAASVLDAAALSVVVEDAAAVDGPSVGGAKVLESAELNVVAVELSTSDVLVEDWT